MKIYFFKIVSALLNLLVVSYVVKEMPQSISEDYLLSLAYVVLAALIVSLGIDTGIERYAYRIQATYSKRGILSGILAVSVLRAVLIYLFALALDVEEVTRITTGSFAFALAFASFLFLSCTALLNGVSQYNESAISHVIRGVMRLSIILIPASAVSLKNLLLFETTAALVATLYCIIYFIRIEQKTTGSKPESSAVLKFLMWNWFARFSLNFISLNTVKIFILQSNHPSALLYAYAVQLTQSLERFLPSKVLAGRYRPQLSILFDKKEFATLTNQFKTLNLYTTIITFFISAAHLVIIPSAFYLVSKPLPGNFVSLILVCAAWLFIINIVYSLNIVSNVLERNYIIFVTSLVTSVFFVGTIWFGENLDPINLLSTLIVSIILYPLIWFLASVQSLRLLCDENKRP